MEEKKRKLNLKIIIPVVIAIVIIIAVIIVISKKGNSISNSYYQNSVFAKLKTFTEITGTKEKEIEEEAITVTYNYQFQDTSTNLKHTYENYLLNDYGFKVNQDKSTDSTTVFEYNNKTLVTTTETEAGFTTYKIKIPLVEKVANENIKKNYNKALELVNNKQYIEARKIFALEGVRDYEDSQAYIYYCNAMFAYEYKQYGDAIERFSKCENILNAKELENELLTIVSKYNGTYYYKHPQYESLSYYMFIKNGKVDFESVTAYKSNNEYLYSYSLCADILHIANEGEGFILTNYNIAGEEPKKDNCKYLFAELPKPENSILISSQGNSAIKAYSGVYEKISNDTPKEKQLF